MVPFTAALRTTDQDDYTMHLFTMHTGKIPSCVVWEMLSRLYIPHELMKTLRAGQSSMPGQPCLLYIYTLLFVHMSDAPNRGSATFRLRQGQITSSCSQLARRIVMGVLLSSSRDLFPRSVQRCENASQGHEPWMPLLRVLANSNAFTHEAS
jgi:hypothetical protein